MLRSRRDVMLAMVAGVATTLTLAQRTARAGTVRAPEVGIGPGMRFGGSIVRSVGPALLGAIPVRLVDGAGRPFTIDLLRHDPATPGVARGGTLGVYLCNDGEGALATDEAHGLAAMAIARHLAEREAAGSPVPSLPTLRERAERRPRPRASA
jgi:hypothetical protein